MERCLLVMAVAARTLNSIKCCQAITWQFHLPSYCSLNREYNTRTTQSSVNILVHEHCILLFTGGQLRQLWDSTAIPQEMYCTQDGVGNICSGIDETEREPRIRSPA